MGIFSQLKERQARREALLNGTMECTPHMSSPTEQGRHPGSLGASFGGACSSAATLSSLPEKVLSKAEEAEKNIARMPTSREELKAFLLRFLVNSVGREKSDAAATSDIDMDPDSAGGTSPSRVRRLRRRGVTLPITTQRLIFELRKIFRHVTLMALELAEWFSEKAINIALRELHHEFGSAIQVEEQKDAGLLLIEVNSTIICANIDPSSVAPLEIPPRVKKRKINDDPLPKRRIKPFPPIPQGDDADLLAMTLSARQKMLVEAGEELRELLYCPTVRQNFLARKFVNKHRTAQEFCSFGSRMDCRNAARDWKPCAKIHFRKLINRWTDESLGDCSYLDTCRHMASCKYVHYALDLSHDQVKAMKELGIENCGTDTKRFNEVNLKGIDYPPQWIQCDLRTMDLSIFQGIASVIMADPPWDIHMELPYGTMTDDEMRALKVQDAQRDGMIFLWVTGRASELARECLKLWGYKRVEEIIWVKTNQLQRIIRTGRTGHWINHSKEHCLVGIKGKPIVNRNLDCDVIVSEVRETSRKPDEVYNLIERMFPNSLKVELFGRPHNVHPNWVTLGNQLDGCHLCCDELVKKYNNKYPESKCIPFDRNEKTPKAVPEPAFAVDSSTQLALRAKDTSKTAPMAIENTAWKPPKVESPELKENQPWRPPTGAASSSTSTTLPQASAVLPAPTTFTQLQATAAPPATHTSFVQSPPATATTQLAPTVAIPTPPTAAPPSPRPTIAQSPPAEAVSTPMFATPGKAPPEAAPPPAVCVSVAQPPPVVATAPVPTFTTLGKAPPEAAPPPSMLASIGKSPQSNTSPPSTPVHPPPAATTPVGTFSTCVRSSIVGSPSPVSLTPFAASPAAVFSPTPTSATFSPTPTPHPVTPSPLAPTPTVAPPLTPVSVPPSPSVVRPPIYIAPAASPSPVRPPPNFTSTTVADPPALSPITCNASPISNSPQLQSPTSSPTLSPASPPTSVITSLQPPPQEPLEPASSATMLMSGPARPKGPTIPTFAKAARPKLTPLPKAAKATQATHLKLSPLPHVASKWKHGK